MSGSTYLPLVAEGLELAGVPDSGGLADRLARYCAMVRRFRRAAGLTAERDDRMMTLKMAIEPLLALHFLKPSSRQALLDVGSGAGSPGIALAAARQGLEVAMLEPDRRKSVFIGEVIRALELPNARALRLRLEDLPRDPEGGAWPVVASRAAMKPARITDVVGALMPGTHRLILFLSRDGVREADAGPYFHLKDQVPLPWRPASRVALFERT